MKKIIYLFILLVSFVLTSQAQEFKKFKVGLGAGYARPGGSGAKAGVLVYLEPAYRVTDAICVGLRLESAVIARGYSEDIDNVSLEIAGIGSYTLNGQYYFSNNSFRPFVGLGLGLFSLAAVTLDISPDDPVVKAESKFGFYPRVGFDAGHFNLSIDYNLVPPTKVEGGDGEFKNSYLGIRLGFSIGGGRK